MNIKTLNEGSRPHDEKAERILNVSANDSSHQGPKSISGVNRTSYTPPFPTFIALMLIHPEVERDAALLLLMPASGAISNETPNPSSKIDLTFLIQENSFSTLMYQYTQIKDADRTINTRSFISRGQNGEFGFWTGSGVQNSKRKEAIIWKK